jgi:hypothetical protein
LRGSVDRRDEARAMLTEIYAWFTEGFDTSDLRAREGAAGRAAGVVLREQR